MDKTTKVGFPLIGVMFLALAVAKFLGGDNWVVWAILAFVFGGFAVFRKSETREQVDD